MLLSGRMRSSQLAGCMRVLGLLSCVGCGDPGAPLIEDVSLEVANRTLTMTLPAGFLAANPLTQADFAEEVERLAAAGFMLVLK